MVAVHDEHPQLLHVEWVPFDADSFAAPILPSRPPRWINRRSTRSVDRLGSPCLWGACLAASEANRSARSRTVFSRTASAMASCSAAAFTRRSSVFLKIASARSWTSFSRLA